MKIFDDIFIKWCIRISALFGTIYVILHVIFHVLSDFHTIIEVL